MQNDASRPRLILASGSPRRRELLQNFGVSFQVRPSGAPEDVRSGESPAQMAERLALEKARWIVRAMAQEGLRGDNPRDDGRAGDSRRPSAGSPDSPTHGGEPGKSKAMLVLGADTTIDLQGEVLGKPADPQDARRMLDRLRGRSHDVITGVALVSLCGERELSSTVSTRVWMRDFRPSERDAYVATGEPMGKAGSYAIQGRGGDLVRRWEGCWNNVMGLPLCEVAHLARQLTGLSLTNGPQCVPPQCFY